MQIKNSNLTIVSNIHICLLRSVVRKYFTFMAFPFHIQTSVIPQLHNKEFHKLIFFYFTVPFRCQNFFLNVVCPSTSRSYYTVWLFGVVEYKYANFSICLLCVSLTCFQFTDICVCCHIYSCSVAFICSCYFFCGAAL